MILAAGIVQFLSYGVMFMSCVSPQALYVLQVFQSDGLSDASVSSVTEYLLTQPILSFVVAGHTPFLPADGESGDEGDAPVLTKDFDSRRNIVNIKLHCIHTRWAVLVVVSHDRLQIYCLSIAI